MWAEMEYDKPAEWGTENDNQMYNGCLNEEKKNILMSFCLFISSAFIWEDSKGQAIKEPQQNKSISHTSC